MGNQKHEDNLPLVRREVESYLANLKQQLLELLQTIYNDPENEKTSFTPKRPKGEKSSVLVEYTLKTPEAKIKFILPDSADKLCNEISSRISSLEGTTAEAGYHNKFRLKGLAMNNSNGYSRYNCETTSVARLDLELAQSGIAVLTQSPEFGPKAQRLLIRLSAISKLNDSLMKADVPIDLKEKVQEAVTTCKANKPSWSEQPFLDKLKDIFSLGIRHMFFHHDETKIFKEKVKPLLSSPGPKK